MKILAFVLTEGLNRIVKFSEPERGLKEKKLKEIKKTSNRWLRSFIFDPGVRQH